MDVMFPIGGTLFSLANLIAAFLMVLTIYVSWRAWKDKNTKLLVFNVAALVILIFFTVGNSSSQFKLDIDPVKNYELERYQTERPNLEIVTPPPRTENLDGFTPLKREE